MNNQEQINQSQTQQAVKVVQEQLGNTGKVQSDQAVTIDRTIHYQEQGTNETLSPDVNQDVSIVPYYKVGKVTINYFDRTNNQKLGNDQFNGYVGTYVKRTKGENLITAKTNQLTKKGYQLDSDGFAKEFDQGTNPQFTEKSQKFTVYFIHGARQDNQSIPGSQTVKYVDQDGKELKKEEKKLFTFKTTDRTVDEVTGTEVNSGKWNAESHDFGKVNVPEIDGYVPVTTDVDGAVITRDQPNKTIRVVYKKKVTPPTPVKKTGSIKVEFFDQNIGKAIKTTPEISGKVGDPVKYDPTEDITNFKKQGYELVSNGFKTGTKFTENNGKTVVYKITLKHGVKTESEQKVANQTIHYVVKGDTPQAPKENRQAFTFTRNKITDLVNGEVTNGEWNQESYQFKAVTSPVVSGYTPDIKQAGGFTATPDQLNQNYTVTYTKKAAEKVTVTIEYIDQTLNNKLLKTDIVSGKPGDSINYKTDNTIEYYLNQGYELVKDGFQITEFPQQTPSTPYKVILGHGSTPVTPDNPGGPMMVALYAASPAHSQVDEEQPTTYYAVVQNGEILGQDLTEQEAKSKLLDVISPTIPGYRLVNDKQKLIDDLLVDAKSNKHTDITVYYTKDHQDPSNPTPTEPKDPGEVTPPNSNVTPKPGPSTPEDPGKVTPPESNVTPTPKPGTPASDTPDITPAVPTPSPEPATPTNSEEPVNSEKPTESDGPVGSNKLNISDGGNAIAASQTVTSNFAKSQQKQLPQTGSKNHSELLIVGLLTSLLSLFGLRKRNE